MEKNLEQRVKELEVRFNQLLAFYTNLEKEVQDLKKKNVGTGLVLDGVNDTNREFILGALGVKGGK